MSTTSGGTMGFWPKIIIAIIIVIASFMYIRTAAHKAADKQEANTLVNPQQTDQQGSDGKENFVTLTETTEVLSSITINGEEQQAENTSTVAATSTDTALPTTQPVVAPIKEVASEERASGKTSRATIGMPGMDGMEDQEGVSDMSGMAGVEGQEGMSGMSGMSGMAGVEGQEGMSGMSGMAGVEGQEGMSGMSGMAGMEGMSGTGVSTPQKATIIDQRLERLRVEAKAAREAAFAAWQKSLEAERRLMETMRKPIGGAYWQPPYPARPYYPGQPVPAAPSNSESTAKQ